MSDYQYGYCQSLWVDLAIIKAHVNNKGLEEMSSNHGGFMSKIYYLTNLVGNQM